MFHSRGPCRTTPYITERIMSPGDHCQDYYSSYLASMYSHSNLFKNLIVLPIDENLQVPDLQMSFSGFTK